MDDDSLRGKHGARRLLAVLGWGELVMLTAAGLMAITLLAYLARAMQDQPAVLTPTPRSAITAPGKG